MRSSLLVAYLVVSPLAVSPLVVSPLAAQAPDSCTQYLGATTSPDVAYDPTHDVFLHVQAGIDPFGCGAVAYGRRHDTSGNPLGSLVTLGGVYPPEFGFAWTWSARVANVRSRGSFVVITGGLGLAVVDAATGVVTDSGSLGTSGIFAAGPNSTGFHDIGGDSSANGDTALVVFGTTTDLYAKRVTVDATGGLQVGALATLRNSQGTLDRRTIASHAGASGRHLIVFAETLPGGDADVRGIIVDGNNQILDDIPIATSSDNEDQPHVDGDGDDWLVAYRNVDADQIECVRVTWNSKLSTSWTAAPRVVTTASGADWPIVAAAGDSYAISYTLPALNAGLASVDATSCTPCEAPLSLSSAPSWEPLALGIARTSPHETLAVTGTLMPLVAGEIIDGFTTDLGGGCASGGRARAHCGVPGNAAFELGLTDAPAGTLAFLALSAGRLDTPCAGGCTLIPDLSAALVLAVGSTDIVGTAALQAPLPNQPALVGGVLYEQWLLFTGSGCFGSFALSNGLRVQLQ